MEPEASILSPAQTPDRLGLQQCRHDFTPDFTPEYIQVDRYHAQAFGLRIHGPDYAARFMVMK